jgi:hypothetical protein
MNFTKIIFAVLLGLATQIVGSSVSKLYGDTKLDDTFKSISTDLDGCVSQSAALKADIAKTIATMKLDTAAAQAESDKWGKDASAEKNDSVKAIESGFQVSFSSHAKVLDNAEKWLENLAAIDDAVAASVDAAKQLEKPIECIAGVSGLPAPTPDIIQAVKDEIPIPTKSCAEESKGVADFVISWQQRLSVEEDSIHKTEALASSMGPPEDAFKQTELELIKTELQNDDAEMADLKTTGILANRLNDLVEVLGTILHAQNIVVGDLK